MSIEVLVADDDPLMHELLQYKLESAGYAVRCVSDGQAALDEIERQRPDILLLDVMMPVVDGFEVLRRLAADDGLRDMMVVMISALKGDEDVVNALNLGAADYLAKPFNPDELIARLHRHAPGQAMV